MPPPWASQPPPSKPAYDPYLGFAPTFNWGGRSWGANDKAKFEAYLRHHGINPQAWYRNHGTAAKVFDPTEQQIYGMYRPELMGIEAERKAAADLWNRRMQNLTGFSAALMPYLQQVPGAIMTPYREGAAGIESAAAGYGGRLNADSAAEAAGANAVIQGAGLPGGVQGGDAGGVLAGLGSLQAELMRSSGGAYGEAAKFLPQTASLEQLQAMRDLMSGAAEADKGYSNDILQVLAGLPETRFKMGQQAQANRLRQQQFALQQQKEEHDWYMKQYYAALATGDRKRANQYLKLAQQREARMRAGTQGLDVNGNPKPGYHIDPQTGLVTKDMTASQKRGANQGAKDVQNVGRYQDDIDRYIKTQVVKENPNPPFNTQHPSFQVAYNMLWNRFKNTVSTPAGKQALKQAIIHALNAHGISKAKTGQKKKPYTGNGPHRGGPPLPP